MSTAIESGRPFRVFNGHTDGSAPLVSGFVDQNTNRQKDLSVRNPNPSLLVLKVGNKDGYINQVDGWDLARALVGGETLVNMAAFLNPVDRRTGHFINPDHVLTTYMLHHAQYNNLLVNSGGRMQEVTSREDLDSVLAQQGKIGMLRSLEGLYGEFSRADIDRIVNLGVSIWDIMWNFDNPDTGKTAATTGSPEDTGLTRKGKNLVRHLAVTRRVAIDLSHASDKTALDVLKIAEKGVPAIATHSGFRAVNPHKRNLPDDIAKRIVQQGGFIGVPFVKSFTGSNVDAVVNHVVHAGNLGILDHIALGPDFDGIISSSRVTGLEDAEVAYRNIATAMKNRGFSDKEIDGVLFNNALTYMQTHLFPTAKVA